MTLRAQQEELVRRVCTEYLNIPDIPLAKKQRSTTGDAPAKGPVWISRTTFRAPPEQDLKDALHQVCTRLSSRDQDIPEPHLIPTREVGVEFIGIRDGLGAPAPEPQIPEERKLELLQETCENDFTILYLHGGGMYFSGPREYRAVSARLARLTKARVASIAYRLAPQDTFPAQILDVLIAYTSLLYPPPGSTHKAAPAHRVVLAGNSSGANVCLSLIQTLLELRRKQESTVRQNDHEVLFHGRKVSLPLPAGVAICCGWCDLCDCLPSWLDDNRIDILGKLQPALHPTYPTDEIWPTDPPREHLYCKASLLDHPLVTPAAAHDWTGAPPLWIACGSNERGIDGNKTVASQALKGGVPVLWDEYEGMCHEFMVLLGKIPQAKHCFEGWAAACTAMANGSVRESRGRLIKMPDCKIDNIELRGLAPLPFDEVRRRMRQRNLRRPVWKGTQSSNAKI